MRYANSSVQAPQTVLVPLLFQGSTYPTIRENESLRMALFKMTNTGETISNLKSHQKQMETEFDRQAKQLKRLVDKHRHKKDTFIA